MPFSFLIIVHIIFLPRLIFGFCLLDIGPDSSPLFSEATNLHLWYRQYATWESPHMKKGQNKAMVVYKNWPVCGDWRIAPRLAILNSPAHSPAYLGAPWAFPIDCCPQLQNSWAWFTEMDSSDPHRDPSRATTPKPRKQKLNGFWNLVTATRKWVSKFTPKVFQTPSTIISAGCKHLQFEYTYERPPRP